jgi:hypothetical protein
VLGRRKPQPKPTSKGRAQKLKRQTMKLKHVAYDKEGSVARLKGDRGLRSKARGREMVDGSHRQDCKPMHRGPHKGEIRATVSAEFYTYS